MLNFSPQAQQVLALARKEADRLHYKFVGTEHLLLGIVALGQGGAVTVLNNLGITLANLRAEVERQIDHGMDEPANAGPIPYTPRVKKVLALAVKETTALGDKITDTEHILIGILLEGDGLACRLLKSLGANLESLRKEILRMRGPSTSASAPDAAAQPAARPPQPDKISCTVNLPTEILDAARKLGMILDEYIEHLHKLHYSKGDTSA